MKQTISAKTQNITIFWTFGYPFFFGSFQRICQLLRDVAISKDVHAKGGALERSAAAGLDAPPEELRAIINQVAIDIHGVYVSRTSTDHSYDGLRSCPPFMLSTTTFTFSRQ